MELLLKLTTSILVSVVLLVVLEKQDKPIAVLLCIGLCCMIMIAAANIADPVIAFIELLQKDAGIDIGSIRILLKATAAAILCEITTIICTEAGYGSLGKTLQFVGIFTIIYLAIPLCHSLLEIVSKLLGGI